MVPFLYAVWVRLRPVYTNQFSSTALLKHLDMHAYASTIFLSTYNIHDRAWLAMYKIMRYWAWYRKLENNPCCSKANRVTERAQRVCGVHEALYKIQQKTSMECLGKLLTRNVVYGFCYLLLLAVWSWYQIVHKPQSYATKHDFVLYSVQRTQGLSTTLLRLHRARKK